MVSAASTSSSRVDEINGSQPSTNDGPLMATGPRRSTRGRSVSSGRGRMRNCRKCLRDFYAVGNQQLCKMAECVAPPTDPNEKSKSTPNPRESRKRARVTSSPPAGSEIEKRMKQTSHPHSDAVLVTLPMSTAGFSADLPPDINQLKENLDSLDEQTLRQRARDLADAADYYRGIALHDSAELAATKARFDEYRIRFADKIFEAIPTNSANVRAAGSASGPEQVTIVATVQEDKMGEKITTEMIDKILGAKKNGPVPQTIQRKDNLVYMSFADAVQSGKAKAILESNPAGSSLFQVVNSRKRLFPAVARSVDLVDLEELRRDLILRNGSLCNSLEEVRPLFRGRDGTVGHVRLLFASAAERDELVRRARIYAGGRRIVVTAVDWNKEVRRCYHCHRYGHIARRCSSNPVCGRCAGSHPPGECNSAPKKCANCSGPHVAGDPSCAEQIKAVRRLRARLDE